MGQNGHHTCIYKQQVLLRMWRKGNCFALLVGMQTSVAPVESSVEFSQKTKNGSAFWPCDPSSGNISEGTQNTNWKDHKCSYVHAALFIIAKIWKQPKCPSVDEWVKQLLCIYTSEYIIAIKMKKMLPFTTAWVSLENIMLSEISQSEKDKYLWFHSYMESNEQTELRSKIETDS